jgi:hypothetical protein
MNEGSGTHVGDAAGGPALTAGAAQWIQGPSGAAGDRALSRFNPPGQRPATVAISGEPFRAARALDRGGACNRFPGAPPASPGGLP